jgi:hypothetical protein
MTTEKQIIEKLKEYIKECDRLMGNWESSHISLVNLRAEISALELQGEREKRVKSQIMIMLKLEKQECLV